MLLPKRHIVGVIEDLHQSTTQYSLLIFQAFLQLNEDDILCIK
jgi:hypothetical protein